jgi:formylglycine-generating enzyme required for sulfatase activity
MLAAECIRDVGPARVEGELASALTQRLQVELRKPIPDAPSGRLAGLLGKWTGAAERRQAIVKRRVAAAAALGRIESGSFGKSGQYWSLPYGEPEWSTIPAGEFWMGSEEFEHEKPVHRLFLPEFQIAPTPITNAQYLLYVQATGVNPPHDWVDRLPPKEKQEHPVVRVSWDDACRYCDWLSQVTGEPVRLPSEAEWEKAVRGDRDQRTYPWGDVFDVVKCNSGALGLGDTTPVGIFSAGASPYSCLDMAGNVWEWTRSLWGTDWEKPTFVYPYCPEDGREDLNAPENMRRVRRGGSVWSHPQYVRCAGRLRRSLRYVDGGVGFRVVVVAGSHNSVL